MGSKKLGLRRSAAAANGDPTWRHIATAMRLAEGIETVRGGLASLEDSDLFDTRAVEATR